MAELEKQKNLDSNRVGDRILELIDNINKTLAQDLKQNLKMDSKVSIAASCFSIYAYQELKEQLENVEELRFIFTSPTFSTENLVYKTEKGEMVRSKSEMIIANMLFENHVPYTYEKEMDVGGYRKIPDFTIEDEESGDIWYWEHCGMMNVDSYRKRWKAKEKLYAENRIVEGKNLIVSEEDDNGFDSSEVKKIIEKYFK